MDPNTAAKNLESYKLDPAIDLNLGVEFTITKQWRAWVQMNNLFNNRYERWNQYPVLGF
jgi:outer membrane cobalamin receptor